MSRQDFLAGIDEVLAVPLDWELKAGQTGEETEPTFETNPWLTNRIC